MNTQTTLNDLVIKQAVEAIKPYEIMRKQIEKEHDEKIRMVNALEDEVIKKMGIVEDEDMFKIWASIREDELETVRQRLVNC